MPLDVVTGLRDTGLDVAWLVEIAPGTLDPEVLRMAGATGRVLLTIDKGFGDLVFNHGAMARNGVILLRARADEMLPLLLDALDTDTTWDGHFVVVDRLRLRATRIAP